MAKRSPAEVYNALTAAGMDPAAAVVLTATGGGESGWDDARLGDVGLENSVWGPSFGVFQIRTVKAETGRGTDRDINWLAGSLAHQAKAAEDISRGGTDFSPWTVWRTGRWKDFLAQVQNAVRPGSVGPSTGSTTPVAGVIPPLPTWGPAWLPWNWAQDAGNAAAGRLNAEFDAARGVAIEALFAVGALALIGAGVVKLAGPRIKAKTAQAERVAKAAII